MLQMQNAAPLSLCLRWRLMQRHHFVSRDKIAAPIFDAASAECSTQSKLLLIKMLQVACFNATIEESRNGLNAANET